MDCIITAHFSYHLPSITPVLTAKMDSIYQNFSHTKREQNKNKSVDQDLTQFKEAWIKVNCTVREHQHKERGGCSAADARLKYLLSDNQCIHKLVLQACEVKCIRKKRVNKYGQLTCVWISFSRPSGRRSALQVFY